MGNGEVRQSPYSISGLLRRWTVDVTVVRAMEFGSVVSVVCGNGSDEQSYVWLLHGQILLFPVSRYHSVCLCACLFPCRASAGEIVAENAIKEWTGRKVHNIIGISRDVCDRELQGRYNFVVAAIK